MKIAVFYHVAQFGLGAFIYQSQIHRLYASGLLQKAEHIHIGVNGDKELFNVPDKAVVKRNTNWNEETETLFSLKDFCKENPDFKVLYIHTKGVSKGTLNSQSWRLMMEHFIIDKWRDNVEYLDNYDCVGDNWIVLGDTVWSNGEVTPNVHRVGHYPGNFWWANASYVNRLDNSYLETGYRLDREFWIGTGPGCKPKSLNPWRQDFLGRLSGGEIDLNQHYFQEREYVR